MKVPLWNTIGLKLTNMFVENVKIVTNVSRLMKPTLFFPVYYISQISSKTLSDIIWCFIFFWSEWKRKSLGATECCVWGTLCLGGILSNSFYENNLQFIYYYELLCMIRHKTLGIVITISSLAQSAPKLHSIETLWVGRVWTLYFFDRCEDTLLVCLSA